MVNIMFQSVMILFYFFLFYHIPSCSIDHSSVDIFLHVPLWYVSGCYEFVLFFSFIIYGRVLLITVLWIYSFTCRCGMFLVFTYSIGY